MVRLPAPVLLALGIAASLPGCKTTEAPGEVYPLIGDLTSNGGRNYAAVYCETRPDDARLPSDPRELMAGDNIENGDYAVYFNDPFEICETEALFENQARGNAILVSQGKDPVYTAKPRPTTCGEWRTAVANGREYILSNPLTGGVFTTQSVINVLEYVGASPPEDPDGLGALLAEVVQQRYGWPASPQRNRAPMPGEDPNQTDGGSLQLPISMAQEKDSDGNWTGKIGLTCFACHIGQIGTGEVAGGTGLYDGHPELYGGSESGLFLGLNGSNTDPALGLHDIEQANGIVGENAFNAVLANPPWMANRTRGTNAADQEIIASLYGRDVDTMDWLAPEFTPEEEGKYTELPFILLGGDQDQPTWWWTHNKPRYLWTGAGSAGSSRGNFFPASVNPYDGHWSKAREADFQDMDMWLNSLEAPAFVGREIDMALAEEGAVLFHTKDLWADPANGSIARPTGNGSCANCHGAYSPRYIHQPGFLPDPRLAGMAGYTVPMHILQTDPAQADLSGFTAGTTNRTAIGGANELWQAYPDAQVGYRMPEERAEGETPFPAEMGDSIPGRQCGFGGLGGYSAPPLHGVWASGPYFHNGSVPTVWDVLSPSSRPNVWRRMRIPEADAVLGDRGFDTSLERAYDYERLGWKYDVLACDSDSEAPYHLSCRTGHDADEPPSENAVDERTIYNTNAYSKGNQGHEYTQVLSDSERLAIIEYLKTL